MEWYCMIVGEGIIRRYYVGGYVNNYWKCVRQWVMWNWDSVEYADDAACYAESYHPYFIG